MKHIERDAKYWRMFYIYQNLLSVDRNYLDMISESREGIGNGVRQESSLPFTLIGTAHNMANFEMMDVIMYDDSKYDKPWHRWHTLKDHPNIIAQRERDSKILHTVATDVNQYHSHLDRLDGNKRAMLDNHIEADFYYLVKDVTETVVGGFATTKVGYLTGLFSLKKGIGEKIFNLRIIQSKIDIDIRIDTFTLFCTGDYLKGFYEKYGFAVDEEIEWNDEFASQNWDYAKFDKPKLYNMSRKVNSLKVW